jgi:hypothetical protein
MQRIFKEHYINNKIARKNVARDDHPAPNQMFCTRSQTLECFDKDGNYLALLHQYKKPDGSIGASGKPDPKRLRIADTIYFI